MLTANALMFPIVLYIAPLTRSTITVCNPPETILWNIDRVYLQELAAARFDRSSLVLFRGRAHLFDRESSEVFGPQPNVAWDNFSERQ
jgi:hypothetical protein